MELSIIEKAVRAQVPLKDYTSLRGVCSTDLNEDTGLIIICGLWSEYNSNNGAKTFCSYYNVTRDTFIKSSKKFKKAKHDIKKLYDKYEVIDNSLLSLIYNFKKITGYDLIKMISVKKIQRAKVNNGAPRIPYQSVRMALKVQLVRNYLAV